ncbi:MAG TPA: hypothetical protein VMS35_01850 [Nitrososphaeraceae archaeon]|nr:hypothetical protein [Nitrososphaeraceae archaeon]
MSSNHESDSSVENIKSWEVESPLSIEEFDDYSKALDLFNIKSDQDEDIILYEVQKSTINGSVIKRVPILNTKQSKKRKEELEKKRLAQNRNVQQQQQQKQAPTQNKNKPQDIKYRIVILVIIIVAFLILLYVLSQLVTSSDTLNAHYSLDHQLKTSGDFTSIA